jgi:hypothetical protein
MKVSELISLLQAVSSNVSSDLEVILPSEDYENVNIEGIIQIGLFTPGEKLTEKVSAGSFNMGCGKTNAVRIS